MRHKALQVHLWAVWCTGKKWNPFNDPALHLADIGAKSAGICFLRVPVHSSSCVVSDDRHKKVAYL